MLSRVLNAPLTELLHGLQEMAQGVGSDAMADEAPRRRPQPAGVELGV